MSKVVLSTALLLGGVEVVAAQHASAATNSVMSYVNVRDEEGLNANGAHVVLFDGDKQVASAVTDSNGRASFDALEDNKIYRIEVEGVKISNAYFKKGNDLNVAVLREALPSAPAVVANTAGATFTAHVINKDMQNVANQKVDLYDITAGAVFYKSMMTAADGNVVFDVPAGRNFAVYVNGVNQGYTLRGVEGSKLENTFLSTRKGKANITQKHSLRQYL
ncbi:hypothetical protein [Macrococcus equipercicus]|uniref:Carboxypeptidase regulatory-like domain-containing protein n=1 Tax=Macrococcus equipercicus TaxID=69967 RepID=A0A9Q9BQX6_9STAP|nr:hypothetical protein [Macrococcus equipercicus]UTH13879.1 hypothetical protein KFV11_00440 [Macrococcus equipercicus]